MNEALIEEVVEYLQAERERWATELGKKKQAHQETGYALSELPFGSLWKAPFRPLLKRFFKGKKEKLQSEITDSEKKIERSVQAEIELRQGKYVTAITLLGELASKFFILEHHLITMRGFSGSMFSYVTNLKNQLISLQKTKE